MTGFSREKPRSTTIGNRRKNYQDYKEAMIANVKAGGDSAARGMLVGMIMGAAGKSLPASWKEGMNGFDGSEL